jgi:Zn-dependent oligopeptidase
MGLDLDVEKLKAELLEFANKAEEKINEVVERSALELENYMKENRPWTDRTSRARQELKGTWAKADEATWEITLAHGVDYGIYLEKYYEERFAIIDPTIKSQGPRVMKNFAGLIESIKIN